MAKASDIISQLILNLPPLANYFSEQLTVTSLTRTGSTVTATTSTPHGYITGQYVTIVGARAPLLVTSLTRVGNIASGIVNLTTPHDLTENNSKHDKIYITGANQTDYNVNGVQMISAINRFQFQYPVANTPATPATGTILLWDGAERGYNGLFQVTVISSTVFTYQITGTPLNPVGNIIARGNFRISGAINLQRAIDAYTKQNLNKLWGFVVLGETSISKNRQVQSDAVAEVTTNAAFLQLELQRIMFYVFVPITSEIAGRAGRDLMEDVRVPLYRSLLRFNPDTGLVTDSMYGMAAIGHREGFYCDAFYVHEFEFEVINQIILEDTFIPNNDWAFRDIDGAFLNASVDPVTMEINLDDVPYVP